MKITKEILISFLKILQKFPYDKVIRCLESTTNFSQDARTHPGSSEIFYLTVTKETVSINRLEIISNKAKNTYKIFSILYDQFLEDYKNKKPCSEFKFLSLNYIAKSIDNNRLDAFSTEDQIRRPLNKLRKLVQQRLREQFGIDTSLDTIIEFVPWNGISTRQFGFRINASNILLKAA
jgi:hypothetical protein